MGTEPRVQSYVVTTTLWRQLCDFPGCDEVIEDGFTRRDDAADNIIEMREADGAAYCDEHWVDPDDDDD